MKDCIKWNRKMDGRSCFITTGAFGYGLRCMWAERLLWYCDWKIKRESQKYLQFFLSLFIINQCSAVQCSATLYIALYAIQ